LVKESRNKKCNERPELQQIPDLRGDQPKTQTRFDERRLSAMVSHDRASITKLKCPRRPSRALTKSVASLHFVLNHRVRIRRRGGASSSRGLHAYGQRCSCGIVLTDCARVVSRCSDC